MKYLFNIFRVTVLLLLSFSGKAQVQENDRAELAYTQRLSRQFPDSAFLLLKEMYSQSLAKKDRAIAQLENTRKVTTTAVIIVVILLVVLGGVFISRQRLKIKNDWLTSEQDRQIYLAQRELMQAELQNRQLQEEKLMQELEVKRKGLTSSTLHVIQKNQLLENLRDRLGVLVKDDKRDQKKQLQQLIQQINLNFNHDQYWNEFRETFGQVHQQFFDHLKLYSEELTGNDLRLLALIKLNLTSGDISTLLGISIDSLRVSRYRLKKKLALNNGESLTAFVQSI